MELKIFLTKTSAAVTKKFEKHFKIWKDITVPEHAPWKFLSTMISQVSLGNRLETTET